jgi:hypothetical protein
MKVIRHLIMSVWMLGSLASYASFNLLNGAPIANDDDNYAYEGNNITGNVALNDSDPNGDVLTYSVVSGPSIGTFTLQSNGQYLYVPDPEYNGFIYITYQACDPSGLCDQATLELAMLFVNDPPQAYDDVFYMSQNTTLTGNVSLNDIEIDDEPNFFTVQIAPSVGTINMNLNGTFTYTPPLNYMGTVTFNYKACDPCEVCDQAVATIYVTLPNVGPTANDDDTFTAEDGNVSGTVANNDSDPEGMTLTYSLVTQPQYGDITFNANGTYIYTPDPNYFGWEVITYQVCDPYGACDQATLTIEVLFVNDPPTANDDVYSGQEDQIINGFLGANDFELDDEFVFYQVFTYPSSGTLNLFNDGYFTYTPAANAFGTFTAVYYVVDPCGVLDFANITFNIAPVNDEPMAFEDEVGTTEDEPVTGSVAGNDYDVENDPLTYTLLGTAPSGTLTMQANGDFTYTPGANYFGYFSVAYEVCDATSCTESVLSIEVVGVNDIPVANNDSFTTQEDVAISSTVATNDSDADGDVLTYTVLVNPTSGTLVLNSNGSFTYTPGLDVNGVFTATYQVNDGNGGTDTAVMTFIVNGVNDALTALDDSFVMNEDVVLTGTVATNDSDPDGDVLTYTIVVQPTQGTINMSTNGGFTYAPPANYFGTQIISVQVCDAPSSCEVTTLTITINAVNDAPVANNDSFSGNEDVTLTGNVATNDSDIDNTNLTYTLQSVASNGTLTFNSNGTFTFLPVLNYFGSQTLNYQVCDAGGLCANASFTLQVNAVNDAPVAIDDILNIQEDNTGSGSVAGNDTDVDNTNLTFTVVTGPSSGTFNMTTAGAFTYNPAANFFGTVTITYNVCDAGNLCDQGLLTINVTNVNDAPVAMSDNYNVLEDGVLGGNVGTNDFDVETGVLTYSVVTPAQNGTFTLNPNGAFVYTPNANFHGSEQIVYQVCDAQGLCDQTNAFISVVSVNDAPVALNDVLGLLVNTSANGNVSINDSDVDSPGLLWSLVDDVNNGTLVFNSNGSYTYTPFELYSGSDQFEYQVCDGNGACDNAFVNINIINNNVPPVAIDDAYTTLEENSFTTNVGGNDSDENEGQVLTFSILQSAMHGELTMDIDGNIFYNPDINFWGEDSFTYEVCDPFGDCDQATVTITVEFGNDLPILVDEEYNMLEDEVLNGNVGANDIELDFELILYTVVEGPFHGELTLFNDGYFTYTPDPNFYGTDYFIYSGCDPCLVCDEGMATIDVQFINDPPVAGDDAFSTMRDQQVDGSVVDNDYDLDEEILLYSVVTDAQNGLFTMYNDGYFSYIPNDGWVGTDYIEYTACDPCGVCTNAWITIEVIAPNTPPTAASTSLDMCADDIVEIDLASLLFDAEEEVMQLQLVDASVASGLVVIDNANKILTYTPDLGFEGLSEITYQICDNGSPTECATAVITVDVQIHDAPAILSAVINNETCFGENDGSISVTAMGDGELTYTWNIEANGNTIDGLAPGEYVVSIEDQAACGSITMATYIVEGPSAPLTIGEILENPIDEDDGGSSTYDVAGGTEPYAFQWFNAAGDLISEEQILTGLNDASEIGNYSLIVTDANNCTAESSVVVTNIGEVSLNATSFKAYPNPVVDQLIIECQPNDYSVLEIFNSIGELVYTGRPSASMMQIDFSKWTSGIYHIKMMKSNGTIESQSVSHFSR